MILRVKKKSTTIIFFSRVFLECWDDLGKKEKKITFLLSDDVITRMYDSTRVGVNIKEFDGRCGRYDTPT